MHTPILPLALAAALSLGWPAQVALAEATQAPSAGPAQTPSVAAPSPQVARLVAALMMPEVARVMRDEGLAHGATLEEEMFPGRGGAEWAAAVRRIYDPERLMARFTARLDAELAGKPGEVAGMQAFFGAPLGARIARLELDARSTLADPAAEEAARVRAEDMMADRDPRMETIRALAATSDLVEQNVTGALNANLAFYGGLAEGGAGDAAMTEADMLAEVWSQEPQVRAETERWLYSYMALAYAPLSDVELEDYRAFSDSAAGRTMNAALFAAFDETFVAISHDLGLAAARQMQGQDI